MSSLPSNPLPEAVYVLTHEARICDPSAMVYASYDAMLRSLQENLDEDEEILKAAKELGIDNLIAKDYLAEILGEKTWKMDNIYTFERCPIVWD